MKRALLLFLAWALVFSLVACVKDDVPTDPTSKNPTAAPTDPTPEKPTTAPTAPTAPTTPTAPIPEDPTDPEPTDPSEPNDVDFQSAMRLLVKYTWYMAVGVCCDFEVVDADMSAYLSDSQKQCYFDQQYRLLCCRTAQEVCSHIDQTMVKDLQVCGYPNDWLFTDDQGALYLIIIPTGLVAYREISIAKSGDYLYAKAGTYDEEGWFADTYFIIEKQNDVQMITQVLRTDINEIPAEIKDLNFWAPQAPQP